MANQQLVDYIKAQLAAGVLKPDLERAVTSAGWSAADASAAFAAAEGKAPQVPMPIAPRSAVVINTQTELRGSRTWLWLLVTIVVAVLAAGAAYMFVPAVQEVVGFYLGQSQPTDESTYTQPPQIGQESSFASSTPIEDEQTGSTTNASFPDDSDE